MTRVFAIIFGLFVAVLVAGFLVLGLFPPHVHRQPVEHVISADKIQGGG